MILNPGTRPVACNSVLRILKVTEIIIHNALVRHLDENDLVAVHQRGFIKAKSWLSNLVCFFDEATRRLDEGEQTDVWYLEFLKLFESLNHTLLLQKLGSLSMINGVAKCLPIKVDSSRKWTVPGPPWRM